MFSRITSTLSAAKPNQNGGRTLAHGNQADGHGASTACPGERCQVLEVSKPEFYRTVNGALATKLGVGTAHRGELCSGLKGSVIGSCSSSNELNS